MKKLRLIAIGILCILALTACTKKDSQQVEANTITDRNGNEIVLPEKMERIITASASNTEILMGLGLGDKIIAYDVYAKDVEGINEDVPTMDFRSPDLEAIIAMEPDVIFANDYNKAGQSDPFAQLLDAGISVVYIPSSTSIEEIYQDISFFGMITKREEQAQKLINETKSKIEDFKKIGESITDKKSVYFEINPAPNITTFGDETFLNEIITIVGGENIFANEKGWITPNEEIIIEKNPQVIITNVNFIDNPVEELTKRAGWSNIVAVKENQVHQVLTNETSRATQNIVKGIESIAKAVYPEYYEG